jgi:hypothetical protein
LRVLLQQGKLSSDEYTRRRAQFVADARAHVGPDGTALTWLVAYAEAARTPEDAREALSVASQYGEPRYHWLGGGPVGRTHLLAGDVAGALPDLERGARAGDAFGNPIDTIQTQLDLGQALERSGERQRACEQYASVLAAWGTAVPRSVSAGRARERRRELGCAAPR